MIVIFILEAILMIDPFERTSNLTRQQWKFRARVLQAHLDRLSVDELMRGGRAGEAPHLGVKGSHRRGYDPNQPRVPAGNSDGGQWTDDERRDDDQGAEQPLEGVQFAAARELPPPLGPFGGRVGMLVRRAKRIIDALRSDNMLYDLFGRPRGTISMMEIDGRTFFGSNSRLPLYTSRDAAEAEGLREVLLRKYPELVEDYPGLLNNAGEAPIDALFHAETNVLLRAAREFGGTLAGRTLKVFTDRPMCPSCPIILPKVGLEVGNPTVTFIGRSGETRTMRDGKWDDLRGYE